MSHVSDLNPEDEERVCYLAHCRQFFEDLVLERELLAIVQVLWAEWVLGSIQDELGVPRLRADALVAKASSRYVADVPLVGGRGA